MTYPIVDCYDDHFHIIIHPISQMGQVPKAAWLVPEVPWAVSQRF